MEQGEFESWEEFAARCRPEDYRYWGCVLNQTLLPGQCIRISYDPGYPIVEVVWAWPISVRGMLVVSILLWLIVLALCT